MRRSFVIRASFLFGLTVLLSSSSSTEAGGRLFRRQTCNPVCQSECPQTCNSPFRLGDDDPNAQGSGLFYCDGTQYQYCIDPLNQDCHFLPDSVWHTACKKGDAVPSGHSKAQRVPPSVPARSETANSNSSDSPDLVQSRSPSQGSDTTDISVRGNDLIVHGTTILGAALTATEPALAREVADQKPLAEAPKKASKPGGQQYRFPGCIYIIEGGSGQFSFSIRDCGAQVHFIVDPKADEVMVKLVMLAFERGSRVTVIGEDLSTPVPGYYIARQVVISR
jgi:hypothetical protein